MGWVAIPENFGDDPRIDALGDWALAAIVRLWCYAGRHETDGQIPVKTAERISGGLPELESLTSSGLVLPAQNGLVELADFTRHNMTHEQREHRREQAAIRKERFMERRSEQRSSRRSERCKTGTGTGTGIWNGTDETQDAASPLPPSAAPQASPSEASFDVVPHETGSDLTESPQEQAMRFMLTPSTRNDGGVDRSWRFYAVRFVIATGGKPSYPTRHRKRWAELLRTHGVEEFCRRISIYFDDPPWKLRDGARDFDRFITNFDLLAAGSGKVSEREVGDATAKFKWEIRERIASMNGSVPALSPEFSSWVGIHGTEVSRASI